MSPEPEQFSDTLDMITRNAMIYHASFIPHNTALFIDGSYTNSIGYKRRLELFMSELLV
jgi:hypothetical protein